MSIIMTGGELFAMTGIIGTIGAAAGWFLRTLFEHGLRQRLASAASTPATRKTACKSCG